VRARRRRPEIEPGDLEVSVSAKLGVADPETEHRPAETDWIAELESGAFDILDDVREAARGE
jgi:hypothetical protein